MLPNLMAMLFERVIDFKPLAINEHAGLYGGKAFVDGACKIGSVDKISSHVTSVAKTAYLHCTASASPPTMLLSTMFLCRLSLAFFWLNTGYLHRPIYTSAVSATS